MKDEQLTVIVLLIALGGLEFARSANVKNALNVHSIQSIPWNKVLLYFIAALILIGLADPMPTLVLWFIGLLIAGVIISNARTYNSLIQSSMKTLGA